DRVMLHFLPARPPRTGRIWSSQAGATAPSAKWLTACAVPRLALSTLPVGTGLDFAAHHQIARQPEALARMIAEAPPKSIDAGRVSFVDDGGRPAGRHFVSIASLGISGAIDRAVNGLSPKWRR